MKFQIMLLPTIPRVLEDGEELRPIGRNNERYQQMLEEVRKICILADELGYDCFSTTEHHFHSEGYEISVAPLLIYANLAGQTKQIKFAPVGLVLTTWDPIRCAEELAVLDHLTKGRVIAGFARGSHNRWVSVLGQYYKASGTFGADKSQDTRNRKIFEEMFEIVKAAWTEDALDYKGQFYQVPFPYEDGIGNWLPQEWTKARGVPGELDKEGRIRKISVVPKPYQQPHPPIFSAFSASEATIRWAAKVGVIPSCLVSEADEFKKICRTYQEVAAEHGRNLKLGESMAACRVVYVGNTYEEAYQLALEGVGRSYYYYFNHVGAANLFRYPGEEGPIVFRDEEDAVQRLLSQDYALIGTVDQVKWKMESLARCHADGELEWLTWSVDQGLLPIDKVLEQIQLFGTEVMPEFHD